eukprot:TRINITY_DN113183_c0_g1_i1.p1 TRINITY_DN113183_c0_g1~~TRINITY_DN113183_c0_g1_i1.p1  ORF type:complete len:321 (-),score=69.29 TRINITY_DN113183_c0_g1_i1:110-1072(-)
MSGDGPGYFAGSDGNSNSKGAENRVSHVSEGSRFGLSGEWNFKAQLRALKDAANTVVDYGFREGSVRDVTDKQRQAAHAKLESTLVEVLSRPMTDKERKKAAKAEAAAKDAVRSGMSDGHVLPLKEPQEMSEAEMCQQVKVLCKRLQTLRKDGKHASRDADSVEVLYELEHIPMSVKCLKVTKVAAELNQPCWRGPGVSAEIREHVTSLVRRWRSMYRQEEGLPDGASAATHARRCRNLSMDLESAVHSRVQKVTPYAELVQAACALLYVEVASARSLLQGGIPTKDFVQRAARQLQMFQASRESHAHGEVRKRSIVDVS